MATKLDKAFDSMDIGAQRKVLSMILADDWAPVIKTAATHALPIIWNMLKSTPYVKKALSVLKDYTGVDLNDQNANYMGNQFTNNISNLR